MLNISIKIMEVSTDISTDQNLSFDAIDSIVSRAVQSTLQAYLSMPVEDRLAPFRINSQYDEEDDD